MTLIKTIFNKIPRIDWAMFIAIVPIILAGLFTMNSFSESNAFFNRQIIWVSISIVVFFFFSTIDFKFLRKTGIVFS